MNPLSRLFSRAWIVVLLAALAFTAWTISRNLAAAEQRSALAGGAALVADAKSPTGYAGGVRRLVLPEVNHDAQQWIVTTQQMLARGEWRVRHLDTDNAPLGRDTLAPSPYRWWLGLVALIDHTFSGRPPGQSVERASLLGGPLLLMVLLVATTLYAARHFGGLAAGLIGAALVLGFPFAGNFLAALPGDRVLAQVFAVWTLLPLGAVLAGRRTGRSAYVVSAIAGALLLWVESGAAVLLLGGVLLGGVAAAWWSRERRFSNGSFFPPIPLGVDGPLPPWRLWSWVGAGATVVAWAAEYAPTHLAGLHLGFIHPLHALAWLGAGELLHRACVRWLGEKPVRATPRDWLVVALAFAAVLALPIVSQTGPGGGLLGPAARTTRLVLLPETPDAANFFEWMKNASASAIVGALLPLVLVVVAFRRIPRSHAEPYLRAAIVLALGPVLVAVLFALGRASHWATAEAALLALLAVLAARTPHRRFLGGLAWSLAGFLVLGPSLDLLPPPAPPPPAELPEGTRDALLHRDLAHWLAQRAGAEGAVVLAPPATTGALSYYGGGRGLSTPDPDNEAGFGAAVRICAASSTDEAEALLRKRGVTHIVMPAWDGFLDEYARLGNNQPEKSLVALLHQWLPPRWLRPVPYSVPPINGLADREVYVFELTEAQEQTVALAHLAEYFLEMGRADTAAQVASALARGFPDDPSALITRATVAAARGDGPEFGRVFHGLKPLLDRGEDADLPWERRVALALVLAQTKQNTLAAPRVQACLDAADEARLRGLTTFTLYRFLTLAKAGGATFGDAALREKARGLLPPELREKL